MSSAVIVGAGARTPVGLCAQQTSFLLRAGLPAMSESPLANASGQAITMAWVPTVDPRWVGPERLVALSRPALEEAARGAGAPARTEVHLAIDEDVFDPKEVEAALVAMIAQCLPGAAAFVTARGEAALGAILPSVKQSLDQRKIDVAIVGGVHSDHDPRVIARLEAGGRLFSRDNLDARIPGEAAAFVTLMREETAARRDLRPLARVLGVGTGKERARPDNDLSAYEALGLTEAVRKATETLRASGRTVGWTWTDLTFEMRRAYEWQAVFVRAQEVLGEPYLIDSPAQRLGYLGAAALPLFAAMAAMAWKHGHAADSLALGTAGTDSGERAAALLEKA